MITSNTNTARWISSDLRATATTFFEKRDREERCQYIWQLSVLSTTKDESFFLQGNDLRSGCGDEPDAFKMLNTLAAFVDTWREGVSRRESGMPAENDCLFPDDARPFLDYADELMCEVVVWEDA